MRLRCVEFRYSVVSPMVRITSASSVSGKSDLPFCLIRFAGRSASGGVCDLTSAELDGVAARRADLRFSGIVKPIEDSQVTF